MDSENNKERLRKAKEYYYKIGAVPCRAFGGELVYFNSHGWNHVLRKGRKRRDFAEQNNRIQLLQFVEYILKVTEKISDYRESTNPGSLVCFWTIERYVNRKKIRVVIRRTNDGRKHFFSIMGYNEKIPEGTFP